MNDCDQTIHVNVPRLALRCREAALSIGVSERTLYAWTRDLDVPHFKLKGTVLYPIRELQDWLTTQAKRNGGSQ